MEQETLHVREPCVVGAARCFACKIRHRSLCAALNDTEISALERFVEEVRYAPGQCIFLQHDLPTHVYNVRRGTIRLFKLMEDGRRQVLGFPGAGSLLGYVSGESYRYGAEAVTPVTMCQLSRQGLIDLASAFPTLERKLLDIVAAELAGVQSLVATLGRKTAQERVATFLLQRHDGASETGLQNGSVDIPMTRGDIADYLGLTSETVSRVLTQFVRDGLITIPRPDLIVFDRFDHLTRLAHP